MRKCDGCTKCCEGWLPGEAHGHAFWPGRKCQFCTAKGCEIYQKRPDDPCKSFKCAWLVDEKIPAWMKPSECGALIMVRQIKGHEYIEIQEAGQRLDPAILSWWLIAYASGKIQNISWMLDGGRNWVGTKDFVSAINPNETPTTLKGD